MAPFAHFTATNTFSMDLWDPSVSPYEVQTPGELLLYTGKKDSQSLDSVLLSLQSSLEGHIIALDILRGDLYWEGHLQGTGGGPNCRTLSILRWFPKPGFPKPVRVDKNQIVGGSQSSKPQRPKTRTMTACSYSDSCSYATSRTPSFAQPAPIDVPLSGRPKPLRHGARPWASP